MRRLLVFVVALLLGSWLGLRVSQGPSGAPLPASETQRAAATAYLEANLPPMPEGWEWSRFAPEHGIELEVGRAPAAGEARGTLVYVPGYTAPLDMYGAEFARLTEAGWTVAAISPRGQGRSTRRGPDPQMGWIDDHATHAADLAAFLGTLEGPVGVIGMSMGGHVALRAQIDHAPDLLGLALIAPMIAIETGAFPEGVARGLTRGFTLAGLGDTYALGEGPWTGAGLFDDADALASGANCARDPARAHLREALFALRPDLRVGGPSARWVSATFRGGDVLAARADEIAVPVWMALAGADGVVRSPASEQLCAAMGQCSSVTFPEARHCMIEDTPALRAAVIDRALAFFEAERTRP